MLTSNQTLTLNKEKNGSWYVECKSWEEKQTALFRETFMYIDNDGKLQKYEKEQDFSNPLDDHTKNPSWRDPHEDLVMYESVGQMLDEIAKGRKTLRIEVCANGWVSNTFIHLRRVDLTEKGAYYEPRFTKNPKRYLLTPIARFIMDIYPENLHIKVIG